MAVHRKCKHSKISEEEKAQWRAEIVVVDLFVI